MESWSDFPKSAGEGFVCVAEVRIEMIQGFASPGRAFDMLITFREPWFQISLVKIPSYYNCSLRICGFQFTWSPMKFFQGCRCVYLGGVSKRILLVDNAVGI
jgi:hypothetical protein